MNFIERPPLGGRSLLTALPPTARHPGGCTLLAAFDKPGDSVSLHTRTWVSSWINGRVLGAIGVSGAKSEEDEEIARAGVAALQK